MTDPKYIVGVAFRNTDVRMEGNRAQFYVPFTKKRNSQIGAGGSIDIANIGELSLLGMNRTDENVKRNGQSAENNLPQFTPPYNGLTFVGAYDTFVGIF